MIVVGERLRLRPPELGDVDLRRRWFSDPEVTRYLPLTGGRQRAAARVGDTYADKLLMSMLRAQWAAGEPIP